MDRAGTFFGRPFGSAVLGGLVVGLFGWLAIAAGWIDSGDSGAAVSQPPLTRPAADTSGGKGLTVSEIYQRDSDGIAFISAQKTQNVQSPFDPFPQQQQATATGSGFVTDTDGHILTNNHVVSGADKITVKIGDGQTMDAKLVGADPSSDVALLQVEADSSSLHPLDLGDSSKVTVGDPVVAIGNPFGLDRTVTSGIVSALQREISAPNGFSISDVIQTDAPINPGNSGGPLIDASGDVIGINSQIESGGGQGSVGIGFAVPINTASDVVKQLETTGEVKRAFLGVSGADVTPGLASAVNLPVDHGALVQQAYQGSPAARAGLKGGQTQATVGGQEVLLGGDIVVQVNGKDIQGMDEVVQAVNEAEPGDELKLTVLRDGKQQEITVQLGERPTQIQDSSTG
ncbi:MAG: S1C family serine protease, partial [Solirubrobacterales bacterium]